MALVESTLKLRDGRSVGLAEVGVAGGPPIVHCHGNGTSRLEIVAVESAAERAGVRLISIDRPGIGRSDPRPGYRLLDWPADLMEVGDQLGIARFAVEGLSGGAPFALACAYQVPERLSACALISPSTGPFLRKAASPAMRAGLWALLHFPGAMEGLMRFSTRFTGVDEGSLDKLLARSARRLGPADEKLLADPTIRRSFARATAEGYRQGGDAPTKDGIVFGGPWGFEANEVRFERVSIWQGEEDRLVPPAAARQLSEALPRCEATFYPHEGHLSTFVNHAADIWKALAV